MMHRTTIMIPENLKSKALTLAKKTRMSLGQLIRESLEQRLNKKTSIEQDPFFDHPPCFKKKAPKDVSATHDHYLYDEHE